MFNKSTRSFYETQSVSSSEDVSTNPFDLSSLTFEEMLPYVCKKFDCDFNLLVSKGFVQGYHEQKKNIDTAVKRSQVDMRISAVGSKLDSKETGVKEEVESEFGVKGNNCDQVHITSLYDNNNSLAEIFIDHQAKVPRLLMKVIAIIAPLYKDIHRMTIRNSKMNASVIYELNKLTSLMFLTDLCLDGCFVPEGNYSILLSKRRPLMQLSLSRCFISDAICEAIVSKLCFPSPAEKNLLVLRLSGNLITDVGAKFVGVMLRTNRHLRYLNLAGNRIGDEGASHILDALQEFPLTYEEITERRRRLISYFKRKHLTECDMKMSTSSITSSGSLKQNYQMAIIQESEPLARKLIEKLPNTFDSNIDIKNGWSYCSGNLTLSHLNLSFNNLTYLCAKKILGVLNYQKSTAHGLLKVMIEGNYMPVFCPEYGDISALINKKITVHVNKESSNKRKSKSSCKYSSGIVFK